MGTNGGAVEITGSLEDYTVVGGPPSMLSSTTGSLYPSCCIDGMTILQRDARSGPLESTFPRLRSLLSYRVGAVRVERNRLQLDQATGAQRAIGSGHKEEVVECGMVLGSIGYRCLPIEGVPYDERNSTIANEG